MSDDLDVAKAEAPKAALKPKTKEELLTLRYRVIFACAAAAVLVLSLLLSILPSNIVERHVRRAADATLAERFSLAFEGKAAPVTGERVYLKSASSAFQFVFLAQGQEGATPSDYADELIFVVPVSGVAGAAAALFYYTQEGAARFIGNCTGRARAGISEGDVPPSAEISLSNLRKWQAKIEAAAKGIASQEGADESGALDGDAALEEAAK